MPRIKKKEQPLSLIEGKTTLLMTYHDSVEKMKNKKDTDSEPLKVVCAIIENKGKLLLYNVVKP